MFSMIFTKKLSGDTGIRGELFGLPVHPRDASVVFIPVPWEVTVSGGTGTSLAPEEILKTSYQIDLFDPDYPGANELPMAMLPLPYDLKMMSEQLRGRAFSYIHALEASIAKSSFQYEVTREADSYARQMKERVKAKALKYLAQDKMVGLVGGEHSTILGFIEAFAEQSEPFGILQIDAHADLRKAYQGFNYSHASIMYNVLGIDAVKRVVSVGVRDFSEEEYQRIETSQGRIVPFFDRNIQASLFQGKNWHEICQEIIAHLPYHVYITLDIDGLLPELCPNTGTPVPGGLSYPKLIYLIDELVRQKRKIIGFDLCEVACNESSDWDALVGGRLLHQTAVRMAASQGRLYAS